MTALLSYDDYCAYPVSFLVHDVRGATDLGRERQLITREHTILVASAKLIRCSIGASRNSVSISVTYANGSGGSCSFLAALQLLSIEVQEGAEARRWAASAHPHDPGRPCKKLAEQQADASPSNTATVPPAGLHRRNLILIALSCAADTDVCVSAELCRTFTGW